MTEVRELTELITPGPAEALAGLLGVPGRAHGELPLLWHWVYLLDRPPQAIRDSPSLRPPPRSAGLYIIGDTIYTDMDILEVCR